MKKLLIISLFPFSFCICKAQSFFMMQKDVVAGYDPDAQAFFTAAGITNTTEKDATNTFVLYLKANNTLWADADIIHVFVGGTSSTFSYNLKNPAVNQLAFTGGTFSATGWNGNGANEADMGVNGNTINQSNFTGAVYSRSDISEIGALFGAAGGTGVGLELIPKFAGSLFSDVPDATGRLVLGTYNTAAMFTATLTASQTHTVYRNATNIGSQTNSTSTLMSGNIFLSSWGGDRYSSREICFSLFSFRVGFTAAQVAALYTGVQAYETALSRNN